LESSALKEWKKTAQRFQWDRAAAGEGIEHPGRAAVLLQDQLSCPLDIPGVAVLDRFPGRDALDQFRQILTLFRMVGAGVVDEGSEGSGAGGGQRPPFPPDVKRGRVAVADVLLLGRDFGDVGDGEVVFDEAVFHRDLCLRLSWLFSSQSNQQRPQPLRI